MGFLDERRRSEEWMDRPDARPEDVRAALEYIRRVNRWLGYGRATVSHFEAFARGWRAGERVTVLDVGTGSGDIPVMLIEWAARRGFDLRVVGVDLHATTSQEAGKTAEGMDGKFKAVRGDALRLPFADGAF